MDVEAIVVETDEVAAIEVGVPGPAGAAGADFEPPAGYVAFLVRAEPE